MQGLSIAGRKRNDGIDYYQTPIWATQELLRKEEFGGSVLEPCCGAGAISKLLNNCISSDIRKDENVFGEKGKDIFTYPEKSFNNIITNPPYIIAQKVIEKSLNITRNKVAMLLKLSFLESKGRYNFFKEYPLKKVLVFCKRVQMYPEGTIKPKNSGTIAYAWYVWDWAYTGQPMIEWII